MAENAAPAEASISRSEFARRRNVSPGRVTQWVNEGKIFGPALDGKKIVESIALEQLPKKLDTSQRTGNGLGTRLDPTPPRPPRSPAIPTKPGLTSDLIADQIAQQKLEEIQRKNRRAERDEAVENGQLVAAEEAAKAAGRCAARMIVVFEGSLNDLATAVAAEWKLPKRDVLHLMRGAFRKVRARATETLRRQAQDLPGLVTVELGDELVDDDTDQQRRTGGDGSDGESLGAAAAG